MTEFDLFMRMGVALAIGLLVGMERGWRTRDTDDQQRAAGLRTYALAGLLGGVSAQLAQSFGGLVLATAFAGFTIAFAAFHWIEAQSRGSASVTAVIAGLVTFQLGALAVAGNEQLAIAAAVAMTAILLLREPLHRWIASVTWSEISAGLILLVMSFLLLPVLPDRAVDPWGAINPHEVWLLAVLMAAISFAGYVAVRLFGDRLGIIVTAAAGGLASSTATTLTLARLARKRPASVNLLAGGIMVSSAVMTVRVGVVAVVLNGALLGVLWPPLLAGAIILGVVALVLIRGFDSAQAEAGKADLIIANPLELATSIKLAAFIAVIMLVVEGVRRSVGDVGLLIVAALSGLADVDAITISLARMGVDADGVQAVAGQGILLAVAVNSLSKAALAGWIGGAAIGVRVFGGMALALVAGGATLALT